MTEPVARPHALYRFFDNAGALLYVGLSSEPGQRAKQHRRDKPWWFEVTRITLEPYPDRASVEAAETQAIRIERPRYNIAKVVPIDQVQPEPYRVPCDECTEDATVFSVLTADVLAYRAERKRLDDPNVPMEEKMWTVGDPDPLSPARWHVTCDEHYPGDDVAYYWYPVGTKLASAVGSLRHIGEKEWVGEDTAVLSLATRLLAPKEARLSRAVTG